MRLAGLARFVSEIEQSNEKISYNFFIIASKQEKRMDSVPLRVIDFKGSFIKLAIAFPPLATHTTCEFSQLQFSDHLMQLQ